MLVQCIYNAGQYFVHKIPKTKTRTRQISSLLHTNVFIIKMVCITFQNYDWMLKCKEAWNFCFWVIVVVLSLARNKCIWSVCSGKFDKDFVQMTKNSNLKSFLFVMCISVLTPVHVSEIRPSFPSSFFLFFFFFFFYYEFRVFSNSHRCSFYPQNLVTLK